MLRRFYKFYRSHYYAVNGALLGLAVGLSLVIAGLIKTIIIAVCIFIGYFIGQKLQKDSSFIKKLIDKILPPGSYR